MDLLESGDEREPRRPGELLRSALGLRLPRGVVAGVAAALAVTLAVAVVTADRVRQDQRREAARVEVDVQVVGGSSSTVSGVARGDLQVLLVNRRENPVRLGALRVEVEGLRVLDVEPVFGRPLAGHEERLFTVRFLVPSCRALVLPGTVTLSLIGDDAEPERRVIRVFDPQQEPDGRGIRFGACPPSARTADGSTPTDVAARPAGGTVERRGAGAAGIARLEVRNIGSPLRLLSVDARVPGVTFTPRVLEGGRTLETEGLVLLGLTFRVPDCSRLQKTGWLVLRIERFGGIQELGLRLTAEPAAGLGPQAPLPLVLDACD